MGGLFVGLWDRLIEHHLNSVENKKEAQQKFDKVLN